MNLFGPYPETHSIIRTVQIAPLTAIEIATNTLRWSLVFWATDQDVRIRPGVGVGDQDDNGILFNNLSAPLTWAYDLHGDIVRRGFRARAGGFAGGTSLTYVEAIVKTGPGKDSLQERLKRVKIIMKR